VVRVTPKRGDVIWADLDPARPLEMPKVRPFLVITNVDYNKGGLLFGVPISTVINNGPYEIPVIRNPSFSGVILTNKSREIDWLSREDANYNRSACNNSEVKRAIALIKAFLGS